jgi:DNA transformation protein
MNRPEFEVLGLSPFTYAMKGKDVALSYWAAPDSIFDAPEDAVRWAKSSWDAAMRGHLAKAQARSKAKAKLAGKKADRACQA